VELKKNISTEKTDWKEDKAHIEVEYNLLQKENVSWKRRSAPPAPTIVTWPRREPACCSRKRP